MGNAQSSAPPWAQRADGGRSPDHRDRRADAIRVWRGVYACRARESTSLAGRELMTAAAFWFWISSTSSVRFRRALPLCPSRQTTSPRTQVIARLRQKDETDCDTPPDADRERGAHGQFVRRIAEDFQRTKCLFMMCGSARVFACGRPKRLCLSPRSARACASRAGRPKSGAR